MTTYKLIDKQGGGLKEDRVYRSEDEVRDDLRSFHSVDVEGAEKMTLDDLLEIGEWELVKVKRRNFSLWGIHKVKRTAEEARQYAIEWQQWASEQSLSLAELAEWQKYFEDLAIRFDLTEEFKENGIL